MRTGIQPERIIPETSFYAWEATGAKHKQPFSIGMRDGSLFAFAGLWESWHGGNGEALETCTILTTEANAQVRPIHDRMPVILPPADFADWLDPRTSPGQLHRISSATKDDCIRLIGSAK